MSVTKENATVELLAVAPFGIPNYIKVFFDEQSPAYVEVGEGVFDKGWQGHGTPGKPALVLPPFPSGLMETTNMLKLAKNSDDETKPPVWVWCPERRFKSVFIPTDERVFNYANIRRIRKVTSNPEVRLEDRTWICQVQTQGTWINAFMKIVSFPEGLASDPEYDSARHAAINMRDEITMYQQAAAAAPDIVPRFLGVVFEEGRGFIGYVSELVEDAVTLDEVGFVNERLFNMVRDAVDTLHDEAGVAHCDLHGSNVLVKRDGSGVFIVDFEHAVDLRRDDIDPFDVAFADNLIWSRLTGRIGLQ
ncbi:uncharacterized protein PG998_013364 [Apiospora kogelbergensis]|uniref:Protein kinase domain-containing protein n=1 Tax=Apiospora kogelbergensis TaxID=1337665 RepID=A0AAW0R1L4_9PEZI